MPKYRVLTIGPLLSLPLLLIEPTSAGRAAWATAIIAMLWATEALPIAVTALLPIVLFPTLGVVPADRVSRNYFADKIVLFFGGLVVAAALEAVALHRRIALRVLLLFGTRPPWLLLGFMCATAFLSMWMSNTATAAMMMPIAEAVITQLEAAPGALTNSRAEALGDSERQRAAQGLGKALVLGVAYAANIGGMATLTGTGPNLVLAGQLITLYPDADGLSFATWLGFALPLSLLVLAMAWALLWAFLLRRAATIYDAAGTAAALRREYLALGPMSFRERLVLVDFIGLALLWITRNPKVVPGWGELFRPHYVTDGTTAALLAVLLFVLPAEPPELLRALATRWARRSTAGSRPIVSDLSMMVSVSPASAAPPFGVPLESRAAPLAGFQALPSPSPAPAPSAPPSPPSPSSPPSGSRPVSQPTAAASRALLEWSEVQRTLPWGVILLLGGGFALADAVLVSGLSGLIGQSLGVLGTLPANLVALVLMLIVSITTAVASNVATASIFVPVVAGLADSMAIHPLIFMLCTTLTCSLAFVLPVSTPPNAMAFSSGRLAVMDMVRIGSCLNVLGVLAVLLVINTTGAALFDLHELPEWAKRVDGLSQHHALNITNRTCATVTVF